MSHFLIFNDGYDWVEVDNMPHAGNAEGVAKAKRRFEDVTVRFAEAQSTAESAKEAEAAKKAETD